MFSKTTCFQYSILISHHRRLRGIDLENNTLKLTDDLEINPNSDFEITGGEEAPILAARLATRTSLDAPLPPMEIRIGSTKGTNALLEKKGAKVTLVVTEGFADLLQIGNQQRPALFQLDVPDKDRLYDQVIEVPERIAADGQVTKLLTDANLKLRLSEVRNEVVAVALLNAYRNPVHELKIKTALEAMEIDYVSLSHALTPTIKILPRAQTALVNAYLSPVVDDYLEAIRSKLGPKGDEEAEKGLSIMTSTGGLVDSSLFQPKDSLLSGPAGGVVGAAQIAESLGFERILTLDMGGTSTDTCRVDSGIDYQYTTTIGDIEMTSPSIAIETVAAGGGSKCYFDGFRLCVGPESAGASPGPACYGAGGPLTVTDVNLLLGKMDPAAMGIPINLEAARLKLEELLQQINEHQEEDLTAIELLRGLEKIANQKMAEAIRKISVAKGFAPEDYALLAFGGAGGLHAVQIAEMLDIKTIVLPFDGGLLSAWGIGQAQIERMAERQVNSRLEDSLEAIPTLVNELSVEALHKLQEEGVSIANIQIREVFLYLRFEGQSNTLEVPYSGADSLERQFEKAYRELFGYYPTNRIIELESVRVISSSVREFTDSNDLDMEPYNPEPVRSLKSHYQEDSEGYPVFVWNSLSGGATLSGPCVIVNDNATAFLEKGWEMVVSSSGDAVCKQVSRQDSEMNTAKEAIALELFTNRFTAIADEMGAQLQRTAFSVNIKERLDFSCAILDREGRLLVNAPHIPVHLGSLGICTRLVLQKLPLDKGDVAITNHPKYGGSHLPDITMLSGVYDDDDELLGYVINRAHHAELGGSSPGSMPTDATTLVEEGVVIPPTYLVRKGVPAWETIRHLLRSAKYPSRTPEENIADIRAALASLRTGEKALQSLARNVGSEKVIRYMSRLKEMSRLKLEKAMVPLNGRSFKGAEQLDDDTVLSVKVEFKKGRIFLNFDGTSKTHPGNLNANISIVYSAVMYVLRLLCKEELPLNGGLMELVDMHLPTSLLNPDFEDDPSKCPAVVGGNTEVSQRLVDTLLKALQLAACSQGTMNNFLFGNDRFGYYETIGGGVGATEGYHGRSAVHQHMTNTKITDPEELEWKYPVRLMRFAIRKGSGGIGKWNGGDGIIREIEILEEVEMTLLSQHRKVPPYGMFGGGEGKPGQQYIVHSDGWREYIEGIDNRQLKPGDRVVIQTPGGGGWGEPEMEFLSTEEVASD